MKRITKKLRDLCTAGPHVVFIETPLQAEKEEVSHVLDMWCAKQYSRPERCGLTHEFKDASISFHPNDQLIVCRLDNTLSYDHTRNGGYYDRASIY